MSVSVHFSYEQKAEEISVAARKAIERPASLADAKTKPVKNNTPKTLQARLQAEYEGQGKIAAPQSRSRQAALIAIIAGATWVLGYALYANL